MKHWQRITLSILAIGGGAVGFISGFTALVSRSNPIEWFISIAFMAIYAWGIWCGVNLLQAKPGAERSNLKFWLVQTPTFGSPLLGYFLSCGFHLTVSLQFIPFKFNANFMVGSLFNYSLLQPGQPFFIGVNLFAVFVVWWLARAAQQTPPNIAVNRDSPTATLSGRPLP